jgi:hypothetical protein
MWRLFSVVLLGAALWGVSLVLPQSDHERKLRSIVTIAVQRPAESVGATPNGVSIPIARPEAKRTTISNAYLPEGASPTASDAPTIVSVDSNPALDVTDIAGSKPVMLPVEPPAATSEQTATVKLAQRDPQPAMVPKVVDIPQVPVPVPAQQPVVVALSPQNSTAALKQLKKQTRALQRELVRIGCLETGVSGEWDAGTIAALNAFGSQLKADVATAAFDPATFTMVQMYQGKACGAPAKTIVAQLDTTASITAAPESVQTVPEPVLALAPTATPSTAVPQSAADSTVLAVNPAMEPMVALAVTKPTVPLPTVVQMPKPSAPIAQKSIKPLQLVAATVPARAFVRSTRVAPRGGAAAPKIARAKPQVRRYPRARNIVVARRYPTYQILQASLFRPLIIARPRFRSQTVRFRRTPSRPAWAYTNGSPPGLPRWMR